jgi:hypothetical protein
MFLIGFYFNIGTKTADCQQFQRGNITSDCLKLSNPDRGKRKREKEKKRKRTNIMQPTAVAEGNGCIRKVGAVKTKTGFYSQSEDVVRLCFAKRATTKPLPAPGL